MSNNFNKLYQTIIEDEIFKASTPEEGIRRKQEYAKILIQRSIDDGDIYKNDDGSYDTNFNISLSGMDITSIPIKFNHVLGDFNCSYNLITSLEGSPRTLTGKFLCQTNILTSLVGSPKEAKSNFNCAYNRLTDLKGAPERVGGMFSCSGNYTLTSLEGAPKFVKGAFWLLQDESAMKFTEDDIRSVCEVEGRIYV